MPTVKLFLLGPPRVELNGVVFKPGRHKVIALLTYLALQPTAQRRATLAALLWPELDNDHSLAYLRRDLAVLHRALPGPWLAADRETVQLRRDADFWVDIDEFHRQVQGCAHHAPQPQAHCAACQSALTAAVALYQDDFLTGFTLRDSPAFDDWQFFQSEQLRRELTSALAWLVEAACSRNDWPTAIEHLRHWLAVDPLHEPAHRQLMQVYAWAGERAAALHHYDRLVHLLAEEVGAPPEAATQASYAAIKAETFPHPQPAVAAPLPAPTLPLIGRAAEVAQLVQLLTAGESRLVTLLGPGGIGKSRLALAVAEACQAAFADGVYFVPLQPLQAPTQLVTAVGKALGYPFYSGAPPQAQLTTYLHDKTLLLVLDNFEHLLAAATWVTDLLQSAPRLRVLITSRARLNVAVEQLFPLGGLPLPPVTTDATAANPAAYGAVQLFCQRARLVEPNFTLTAANQDAVIQLCHWLAGMPLAILLAAAWSELLAPAAILAQLTADDGAALDLLASDLHDLPARQRSMRAVFASAWQLLTPQEQTIFQAFSLVRGGATLTAAQAITGATLPDLHHLVAKSFLRHTTDRNGQDRFDVHELLRQYGAEKLAQQPAAAALAQERHATFFLKLATQWGAALRGKEQLTAIALLDAESENIHAAWQWALQQQGFTLAAPLVEPLCLFYEWVGRASEGELFCQQALMHVDQREERAAKTERAELLAWQGAFVGMLDQHASAHALWQEALTLLDALTSAGYDVRATRARLYLHRGRLEMLVEEKAAADRDHRAGLALFQACNDTWWSGKALEEVAWIEFNSSHYPAALTNFAASLAIRQRYDDRQGTVRALLGIGYCALCLGDLSRSQAAYTEIFAHWQMATPNIDLAGAWAGLSWLHTLTGELTAAVSEAAQALTLARRLGMSTWISHYQCTFASEALIHSGRYDQARQQLEAGLITARRLNLGWAITGGLARLAKVALVEGRAAAVEAMLQESLALSRQRERADERADALLTWSTVNTLQGNLPAARLCLIEALQIATQIHFYPVLVTGVVTAALLTMAAGETEQAIAFYSVVQSNPYVLHSHWFRDVYNFHFAQTLATMVSTPSSDVETQAPPFDLAATVYDLIIPSLGRSSA